MTPDVSCRSFNSTVQFFQSPPFDPGMWGHFWWLLSELRPACMPFCLSRQRQIAMPGNQLFPSIWTFGATTSDQFETQNSSFRPCRVGKLCGATPRRTRVRSTDQPAKSRYCSHQNFLHFGGHFQGARTDLLSILTIDHLRSDVTRRTIPAGRRAAKNRKREVALRAGRMVEFAR